MKSPIDPLSRTLGYGEHLPAAPPGGPSAAAPTPASSPARPPGFDGTLVAFGAAHTVVDPSPPARLESQHIYSKNIVPDPSPAQAMSAPSAPERKSSTVLPDVEGDGASIRLVPRKKSRYAEVKKLGEGGMGEVTLALDEDIGRHIAVKRLHAEALTTAGMARFVDEVRIVGQLEHPNIVPIHDVGVDEQGRYFFVMKYVQGETLEGIIDKLRARDPAYVEKYTVEARVELFLGLLRALQHAHANGIVHRDLKPANVMVGPYGEVMLMDWGVAKPVQRASELGGPSDADDPEADKRSDAATRPRMFTTRHGALIGTPAYMSPEQACGLNDRIDARSDLYAVTVMLHEALGLKHYLAHKNSVVSVIVGAIEENVPVWERGWYDDAPAGSPPVEYLHLFKKGLAKKPDERFQTAAEMMAYLQAILEGRCMVQCPLTFTKRATREVSRLVDRNPWLVFVGMISSVLLVLSAIGLLIRSGVS
jgi:serine/threonine protein kinase